MHMQCLCMFGNDFGYYSHGAMGDGAVFGGWGEVGGGGGTWHTHRTQYVCTFSMRSTVRYTSFRKPRNDENQYALITSNAHINTHMASISTFHSHIQTHTRARTRASLLTTLRFNYAGNSILNTALGFIFALKPYGINLCAGFG